jgi:transposase InsO family protein
MCIDLVRDKLVVSERRACRVLGQHRSTQRHIPRGRADEEQLVADMIELARQYGRYGYRRIAALLRDAGWEVNNKRVERLWRREGLKVPMKQPKKGRLWLNDGSCIRLRPAYRDHVWSYDFVHHRTDDGRAFRTLNILDEYGRECLAIRVKRKLNSTDVIDVLIDLFILRGVPAYIRSDNGPEFVAEAVRKWITAVGAKAVYIEPGSPWENGYIESFNARFRDELLNGERMEETLQHEEAAQCVGLPPASPGNHRSDGTQAGHALTFKPDHSMGAPHRAPTLTTASPPITDILAADVGFVS